MDMVMSPALIEYRYYQKVKVNFVIHNVRQLYWQKKLPDSILIAFLGPL